MTWHAHVESHPLPTGVCVKRAMPRVSHSSTFTVEKDRKQLRCLPVEDWFCTRGPLPVQWARSGKEGIAACDNGPVSGHVAEKAECRAFRVVSVCVRTGSKNFSLPTFCKDTPEMNPSGDLCFGRKAGDFLTVRLWA